MKTNFLNKKTDCTGDAITGDYVFFKKAIFIGNYPKSKFSHYENIEGLIIKDSYGKDKQQHTFTIEDNKGNIIRIKGRNLYRNGCERLVWKDENKRDVQLEEKHQRGKEAKEKAELRKAKKYGEVAYSGGYDGEGACMYCGATNGHYVGCARIIHY